MDSVLRMSVEQLLQRFPRGFAVRPNGEVYEVLAAHKSKRSLPKEQSEGGFLVVRRPEALPGDEFYGQGNGNWSGMTANEMAEHLDRLIKLADTVEEDGILAKLYQTYSERLDWAAKELMK